MFRDYRVPLVNEIFVEPVQTPAIPEQVAKRFVWGIRMLFAYVYKHHS